MWFRAKAAYDLAQRLYVIVRNRRWMGGGRGETNDSRQLQQKVAFPNPGSRK
jgi:hypothetical protein